MRLAPKSNKPNVVTSEVRQSFTIVDTRRKCIVCDTAIGGAKTEFTNYKGNIGKAHATCVEGRADA